MRLHVGGTDLPTKRAYAGAMSETTTPQQLERDLHVARHHGRWLSDEERLELEREESERLQNEEQQRKLRTKLTVLAGVCVLLPPMWPLALGLTLYLLFPRTMTRVGFAAGVFIVSGAIVGTGLLIALIVWLLAVLI